MSPKEISAVLVTKGDVDLSPILESLACFGEVVVWDNSKEPVDRKVYGRYLAIERCRNQFIYVQDDDCIIPALELLRIATVPSMQFPPTIPDPEMPATFSLSVSLKRVVCNVPSVDHRRYYDALGMSLVGWGAIFHRGLAEEAFCRYARFFPFPDEIFERECDRVFTALAPCLPVNVGMRHLPHAHGADRMGREPRHGDDLQEIRRRIDHVKRCEAAA